jgi:hypothetical protein
MPANRSETGHANPGTTPPAFSVSPSRSQRTGASLAMTAFVDPGQGNVHVGFNETAGETVIYATFLDVPRGQPATIAADDPGCAL